MVALLSRAAALAAASFLLSTVASAQEPAKNVVRKELAGLPLAYVEAITKGEAAFVARDYAAASSSFQEAIKADPQRMLGFYRLGEAQLAAGKVDEADGTWQTALGKKGPDDLKAKVLFVIADVRERQKKWQPAKEAWGAYASFLQTSKAHGFANTAAERQKQADRRMKDEKDYGEVKDRIAKREAEKVKEAEENAKKDKLNK